MTNLSKSIVALVGAVVIGFAIYGAYQYPVAQQITAGSSAGATFNTAKFAGIVMGLANAGANGTSSSILNTDAGNRYVTGLRLACGTVGTSKSAYDGAGLTSLGWLLTVGTSSAANPATLSSTFPVANAMPIPTTTPNLSFASTSAPTVPLGNAAIWHTGEYMSFSFNATNTAACTVGVDYIGS